MKTKDYRIMYHFVNDLTKTEHKAVFPSRQTDRSKIEEEFRQFLGRTRDDSNVLVYEVSIAKGNEI